MVATRQAALGTGGEPLIPAGEKQLTEPTSVGPELAPDVPPVAAQPTGDAAPADEGTGDGGEGAPDDQGATAPLVAKLPGRTADDPDFEIEVSDQETLERLNHLRNGFQRTEQLRAERARFAEEQERFADQVDQALVDPIDFLGRQMAAPDLAEMALHLLANPEVLRSAVALGDQRMTVEEALTRLLDAEGGATLRSELRAHRAERRDERRTQLEERRTLRRMTRESVTVIQALVPPNLSEEQVGLFLEDARADLLRAAQQSETGIVHPRDVPRVLARRLKAYGMTEDQVQAALDRLRRGPASPPSVATPDTPGAPGAPRRTAKPTIQQLQAASDRRKSLAVAPPGAGAPAPQRTLPKNIGLKEAVSHIRGQRRTAPL